MDHARDRTLCLQRLCCVRQRFDPARATIPDSAYNSQVGSSKSHLVVGLRSLSGCHPRRHIVIGDLIGLR